MVRTVLKAALTSNAQIEVVGQAADGVEALEAIRRYRPHVVTLDVEMPRMNGIGVLERVVGKAPVSFVMISTLTQSGAQITFEALNKGAFDFIAKPQHGGLAGNSEFRSDLHTKILAAANSKGRTRRIIPKAYAKDTSAPSLPPNKAKGWVVALGISCGGPQTLTQIMPMFPSDFVPILITQHMPAVFTESFAKHLDNLCGLDVREAQHMQKPKPGEVLIAPGNRHMKLVRKGASLMVHLEDGEKVTRHKPSVDVLFESVAKSCGPRSIGIIMTGMGMDGARGLRAMRAAGAWTIAQDEESSVVYGMPKEAVNIEAADYIVNLPKIPFAIAKLLQRGPKQLLASV